MEREQSELVIDPSWCKGCGICVAFCPKDALELVDEKVRLKADNSCILCGQCEMRCPDYAIYLAEKTPSEKKSPEENTSGKEVQN